MNIVLSINEKISPLQSVIILSIVILISSFFAISKSKTIKRLLIILASVSLIIAFYLNIYSFISMGSFSNFLLSFEYMQMIEVSIIIFSALNLLFFISIYNVDSSHFIKILILFLFSTVCAVFIVLARNSLFIFTSFAIFILTIFS